MTDNPFDKGWIEWLSGCFPATLDTMPPEQRAQLENAFYAGAAFAGRCAAEYGNGVVIDAIEAHLARRRAPTQQ